MNTTDRTLTELNVVEVNYHLGAEKALTALGWSAVTPNRFKRIVAGTEYTLERRADGWEFDGRANAMLSEVLLAFENMIDQKARDLRRSVDDETLSEAGYERQVGMQSDTYAGGNHTIRRIWDGSYIVDKTHQFATLHDVFVHIAATKP